MIGSILRLAGNIGFLVLGLFQLAAIMSGLEEFGLHWILAGILSFVLAYIPIIGTGLGVYGAVAGWGWSWAKALGLFFGPLVAIAALLLIASAVEKAGKQKAHERSWDYTKK